MKLVGVKEAAELLGVHRSNFLRDYVRGKRANFPEPIATLACGQIWLKEDVEQYLNQRIDAAVIRYANDPRKWGKPIQVPAVVRKSTK